MIHINHFTSHFFLYLVKLDSTIKDTDTDTDKSYLFKSKLIVPLLKLSVVGAVLQTGFSSSVFGGCVDLALPTSY